MKNQALTITVTVLLSLTLGAFIMGGDYVGGSTVVDSAVVKSTTAVPGTDVATPGELDAVAPARKDVISGAERTQRNDAQEAVEQAHQEADDALAAPGQASHTAAEALQVAERSLQATQQAAQDSVADTNGNSAPSDYPGSTSPEPGNTASTDAGNGQLAPGNTPPANPGNDPDPDPSNGQPDPSERTQLGDTPPTDPGNGQPDPSERTQLGDTPPTDSSNTPTTDPDPSERTQLGTANTPLTVPSNGDAGTVYCVDPAEWNGTDCVLGGCAPGFHFDGTECVESVFVGPCPPGFVVTDSGCIPELPTNTRICPSNTHVEGTICVPDVAEVGPGSLEELPVAPEPRDGTQIDPEVVGDAVEGFHPTGPDIWRSVET